MTNQKMPIIFVPHGGGPMPLLGDPNHQTLTQFLANIDNNFSTEFTKKPAAILMVSAHWEENVATVSSAVAPKMIYDYYGFPKECYQIQYPAPGQPVLAKQVLTLLKQHEIKGQLDDVRGFDHGTFVPLKLMYPKADIPVVQLSLVSSLDPQHHLDLGKAIASLAAHGVLIIGSGFSFHNMQALMQNMKNKDPITLHKSQQFDQWLNKSVLDAGQSWQKTQEQIVNWAEAPHARFAQPREEHLLPLLVCMGAAQGAQYNAKNIFDDTFMGVKVSGFIWQEMPQEKE